MRIEICDRCKKLPSVDRLPYVFLGLTWNKTDLTTAEYWLGKKNELTLCTDCFEEFMRYIA